MCCPRCYSPRCYLAVNIDSSRYSSRIRSPRAAACCFIGFVLEPAARAASRRLFNLDSHPRKKKAQRASTAPGAGIGGSLSRRPRIICIIRYLITSTAGKQTTHGINATEAETMQITQKQPHTRALRSLCAVAPSLLTRLSDVFLTSGGSVRPHHYTPLIVSVLINNLQYKKKAFFDDSSRYVTGEKQCVNYSRSIRSYLCLVSTRVGGGGDFGFTRQEHRHHQSLQGHTPLTDAHQRQFRVRNQPNERVAGANPGRRGGMPVATPLPLNHISLAVSLFPRLC